MRTAGIVLCATVCICSEISLFPQTAQKAENRVPKVLTEPVFGITYDPSKVHFEIVPPPVRYLCSVTFDHEYVHAHVKSGKTDYYVISGYSLNQDGDSFGYIAMVVGKHCETYDMQSAFLGEPPAQAYGITSTIEQIPGKGAEYVRDFGVSGIMGNYHYIFRSEHEESLVHLLIRDSLDRSSRAFGGRQKYQSKVCTADQLGIWSESSERASRDELQKFCSDSPGDNHP
jgi:hypothetical protein